MREHRELLAGESVQWNLDIAAAQIATIEYPDLDVEPVLAQLDSYARNIGARVPVGGREFVDTANQLFFEELGFTGNEADYYDVRNSCLNDVLRRRLGIPITLAVIYMEVGRRLHQPVYGVGLPGHFVVEFDDEDFGIYIDVFHQGRLMSADECETLVRQRTGTEIVNRTVAFRRATRRQILTRMLQNLKGVYTKSEQWAKQLQVCDLLVEAYPNAPEEIRARAVAQLKLKRFAAARVDLKRYLELAPQAPDEAMIREQIGNLDKWSAQWN
jgi:regulator of sirC expression with transglutaminase-like and TPR domain